MTVLIQYARPTNLGHQAVVLDGKTVEHETFGCAHCGKTIAVPHRADPATVGGMCRICMKLTCPACTALGRCSPFESKLELSLRRDRFLRRVG